MKPTINISIRRISRLLLLLSFLFVCQSAITAQDSTAGVAAEIVTRPKPKPVKNTFSSVWMIDNQSVMVSQKGTFEMDIMHRFGTVDKGYDDFWGFFAPSNIRLGVSYAPINRLNVGIGPDGSRADRLAHGLRYRDHRAHVLGRDAGSEPADARGVPPGRHLAFRSVARQCADYLAAYSFVFRHAVACAALVVAAFAMMSAPQNKSRPAPPCRGEACLARCLKRVGHARPLQCTATLAAQVFLNPSITEQDQ